ncbi:MAG: arsenite efflux transporter metallochaperone ArsD [Sphaerochaeta sp.]
MKEITIYEPAMCCPTGLCGVGVDPELLRISTIVNNLEEKDIEIKRYNLINSPMQFVTNKTVNEMINKNGVDDLPFVLVDDQIVITGRYPTNEEIAAYLDIPLSYLAIEDTNK